MAPKFGNYLFRNLKSGADAPEKASPNPSDNVPVEDQEITLRPADFTTEIGALLNWGTQEPKHIRVKLKQTDGLMDGRVTISAKILRDIYPCLVPAKVQEEAVFPLSLRSVVLQLQNVIRSVNEGSTLPGAPDFDTPIAQVAREDEGFFKLEDHSSQPRDANQPAAPPGGEFGSVLPMIREKPQVRENLPSVQPVQVVAPFPSPESQAPQKPVGDRGEHRIVGEDPFADLPKPKLGVPPVSTAPRDSAEQDISKSAGSEKQLTKPERRRGLERLQELFLTDDFLDAGQVAELLCAFPKVKAALIMSDDGTRLGGDLPEGYQVGPALSAPVLMRAVREFGTAISSAEVCAFTLLAGSPISVFLEGRICMLVVHEGRGLLPGMRERFKDITKALDALYDPGEKGYQSTS
jgi:hypothetical protein